MIKIFIENDILYCVYNDDINPDGTFIVPEGVFAIGHMTFENCQKLTKIIMPNSVHAIGNRAFLGCHNLKEIIFSTAIECIGYQAFEDCYQLKSPKNIYKAFNSDMTGFHYQFEMNKWSKNIRNIELCKTGYHYCTNLFEIFNYKYHSLDNDIIICLCEKGHKTKRSDTSKCVTNKIKPVRRLTKEEIIKILNGEEI